MCEILLTDIHVYLVTHAHSHYRHRGWSGGAMVLGKLPVPGRPIIWIIAGQGPTALAVGAGGGCLDFFTLIYHSLPFLPLFWRRPDIDWNTASKGR